MFYKEMMELWISVSCQRSPVVTLRDGKYSAGHFGNTKSKMGRCSSRGRVFTIIEPSRQIPAVFVYMRKSLRLISDPPAERTTQGAHLISRLIRAQRTYAHNNLH